MLYETTNKDKILKTLQTMELELLQELDRICRKYNIQYSLGGGTCLGQVRHGGFIPWDDDIDVDMTKENYDKFMVCAEKELDKSKYILRYRDGISDYLRTAGRLEFKDSHIGSKAWDRSGFEVGVFIDIFQWNYLPNNRVLRKILTTLLFYTRCVQNYISIDAVPKKVHPKLKPIVRFIGNHVSAKVIISFEEWLKRRVRGKTEWIIDDAVIHGNHMGYPAVGTDTFEDVKFENLLVRNKKNTDVFLRSLYGPNYMEWLPPKDRISHHKWTNVYLGKDAVEKYGIPENYSDYLTISYNEEKLMKMKELSLEMAQRVYKICENNEIKCYSMGVDLQLYSFGLCQELGDIFMGPIVLGMELADYNAFCKIAQQELGKKYFLQNRDTEPLYAFEYSKVRLNFTSIRDKRIPRAKEEQMNEGLFLLVVPLIPTSDDAKQRKQHLDRIKRYNGRINFKWKNDTFDRFCSAKLKKKARIICSYFRSYSSLRNRLHNEWEAYGSDTEYLCDGSGFQLKHSIISRKSLAEAEIVDYYGTKMLFPKVAANRELSGIIDIKISELAQKNNIDNQEFKKEIKEYRKELNELVSKRYLFCFLNYFDNSEYQLSALRYDEKQDRLLTNKELLGYD
ncbi:MAG: LicD family protein [Bacillota bacterium]|nr:LicD family protein [Bacillota bacterium]